ncbi:hypothetical protein BDQ94DRAFT_164117 [Aspergillus welwitschiae]|uniref:Uncharacterized protein n=1 Tax=Aspergillus welwitschiae TaxID=1341132 RepID=A0A3F3PJE6_9EURO|nr:hypothetical protein BDQ94DRAFT_164117 [Aspergillus welwitschiae]RDH26862.1 hypothetical protein BDQ94DRAFT_164117 [Aspergillus welwitschiae]
MSTKLGNIYGEILFSDSVMLLAMVMTIWALSTAMIWGLVIHQRNSESWNGQLEIRSSTSNHPCCEATELAMRHESNKRRGRRLCRPHHAHHSHRSN